MNSRFKIGFLCCVLLLPLSLKAEERLSVLTWNTHRMGQFRKPDQNEVLRYLMQQQDADIICLQEVDVYKDAKYLTLPDVRQTLSRKYPYSYIDFAIYNRRHQYGTMVWSRFPLVNKQSIHYQSRGNISNRCDVVVRGDTIRLINNHLESYSFTSDDIASADSLYTYEGLLSSFKRLWAKWSKAIGLRNEQARVVRKEIEASPYPVIAVGDFNSIALSYAYWHISNDMHDAWRETNGWRSGATCEKRGIGVRIDYILTSKTIVPVGCEVKQTTGSDHRPVVATLAW